jgi:hypothetical protein
MNENDGEFFLVGQFQVGHEGMKGPYGTNEGDIWAMGGPVGDKLLAQGKLGIWEMLRVDGKVDQRMYCVELDNPRPEMQDLIARARKGTEMYLSAQAAQN